MLSLFARNRIAGLEPTPVPRDYVPEVGRPSFETDDLAFELWVQIRSTLGSRKGTYGMHRIDRSNSRLAGTDAFRWTQAFGAG